MFTGDRSGDWLYRALHRAGLANQPGSQNAHDGLTLSNVMITAVCHCAPPDNKPTTEEIANCQPYLAQILASREWSGILCLGGVSWQETLRLVAPRAKKVPFAHGATTTLSNGVKLFASYHPSQQNTFTGRLTEAMLDDVVGRFAISLSSAC